MKISENHINNINNPDSISRKKLENHPIFLGDNLRAFEIQLNSLEESIELVEELIGKFQRDELTSEEKLELKSLLKNIYKTEEKIGKICRNLKPMLNYFEHESDKENLDTLMNRYKIFLERIKPLRETLRKKILENKRKL